MAEVKEEVIDGRYINAPPKYKDHIMIMLLDEQCRQRGLPEIKIMFEDIEDIKNDVSDQYIIRTRDIKYKFIHCNDDKVSEIIRRYREYKYRKEQQQQIEEDNNQRDKNVLIISGVIFIYTTTLNKNICNLI